MFSCKRREEKLQNHCNINETDQLAFTFQTAPSTKRNIKFANKLQTNLSETAYSVKDHSQLVKINFITKEDEYNKQSHGVQVHSLKGGAQADEN